jgi:hypothetical protein
MHCGISEAVNPLIEQLHQDFKDTYNDAAMQKEQKK